VNAFPQRATPGPLFYRGLAYGFAAAALLWIALVVLVYYLT
jgi:hypothetical protein